MYRRKKKKKKTTTKEGSWERFSSVHSTGSARYEILMLCLRQIRKSPECSVKVKLKFYVGIKKDVY